jgi:uncharacterized damage-inducible protein DinB
MLPVQFLGEGKQVICNNLIAQQQGIYPRAYYFAGMNAKEVFDEFISQSVFRLNENTPRIKKCFDEMTEEELWQRPNDVSNSAGNLVLHLCGNITQYIISALGNNEDIRARDEEFAARGGMGKAELFKKLEDTVAKATAVMKSATGEALMQAYSVQGFTYTGIGIIIHVVEHYSYHTGQMAFWTKMLKSKDLGFYAHIDLNVKNRH